METALLAPITAIYAAVLTFVYIVLTFGVIGKRRSLKVGIGHGKETEMEQAIRVHGNFSEYIPLALVLFFLAEVNHASSVLLYVIGACLTVARILHAIGLNSSVGVTWQRFSGASTTFVVLLVLAVTNLVLAF